MYEDLHSIDFSTLQGAGTGGAQGIEKLLKALYGTLATAGYMGTEYQSGGDKYGAGLDSIYSKDYSGSSYTFGGWEDRGGFNIDSIIGELEQRHGGDTQYDKGMMALVGLLKNFQSKDVVGGYGQSMGTISSEIGSELGSLTKGYGVAGKGGRYGKLGTGGRQLGRGGRQAYTSDYYSLIDKQNEMQQNLQEDTLEQFMGNVGNWMQLHPSTET